jgi:hypothetical protein
MQVPRQRNRTMTARQQIEIELYGRPVSRKERRGLPALLRSYIGRLPSHQRKEAAKERMRLKLARRHGGDNLATSSTNSTAQASEHPFCSPLHPAPVTSLQGATSGAGMPTMTTIQLSAYRIQNDNNTKHMA